MGKIPVRRQTIITSILALPLLFSGCNGFNQAISTVYPASHSSPIVDGPTAADYEAAAQLLEANAQDLVKNITVAPHWLGTSGRFWYQRDGDEGVEFVVVDVNGNKSPAFDHRALAMALNKVLDENVHASNLGLSNITLSVDLASLTGIVKGRQATCDLVVMSCSTADVPIAQKDLLYSPKGKWAVFSRDNNLFLVEVASGDETQLTTDGASFFSYGKMPDSSLINIQIKKNNLKLPPYGAAFSPDGRFLIVPRVDERHLAINPFVEWVPTDGSLRPIVHEVRTEFVGDRNRMQVDQFVFDTETGKKVKVEKLEADGGTAIVGWSLKRKQAFMTVKTRDSKKLLLVRVDLITGKSTVVIEELSKTRAQTNSIEYKRSNIRIVNDGAEVVWFSDRSGWGHLYLYDAQTGKPKNNITDGSWLVQDVHQLDSVKREVYFTAGGREFGRDPYYRHLYKVSLDGGQITLLTETNADHHFSADLQAKIIVLFGNNGAQTTIRPDLGVFIDTYSTVDQPPITVLRSTQDGSIINKLEVADASALYAVGWKAPVRQAVKAADGITDIYTVYYAPLKTLSGGKHPVIDAAYGGPQVAVAPVNFLDAYRDAVLRGKSALTRLGFAVVSTDGRGTPLRSSAFRDAGYTQFTQVGIDDHIAAIKQLAEHFPEIDDTRVGIQGWSWGGTFSAQAILSRPNFYDVATSGAGVYDYGALYTGFNNMIGTPVYGDGTAYRDNFSEKPANWDKLDITKMAGNLKGKLLIIYGDMDENVPQSQAFRLVDALIKANKRYDLLYLPNGTHSVAHDGYVIQRRWDYFVEHLMDSEPPNGVTITNDRPPPYFN